VSRFKKFSEQLEKDQKTWKADKKLSKDNVAEKKLKKIQEFRGQCSSWEEYILMKLSNWTAKAAKSTESDVIGRIKQHVKNAASCFEKKGCKHC